jgi:hypothetical protein
MSRPNRPQGPNQPVAPGSAQNNPLPQNVRNDAIIPSIVSVPEVKNDELAAWLNSLYQVDDLKDEDLLLWVNMFQYQGFNRKDVLKQLAVQVNDRAIVMQLILVAALRGPQAGSQIKLTNGKTSLQMGIPASGQKGSKALSMNKIVSATADLAAFLLKKINPPKRMMMDLPSWLQFPSAGSIRMPANLRTQHIEFSKRFSTLIGGSFNEQIYSTMEANSYLDERLHLFE